MKKCELCNNKYYILTFDTKSNQDEIQKCDWCNIYKTDKEAIKVANSEEVNQ